MYTLGSIFAVLLQIEPGDDKSWTRPWTKADTRHHIGAKRARPTIPTPATVATTTGGSGSRSNEAAHGRAFVPVASPYASSGTQGVIRRQRVVSEECRGTVGGNNVSGRVVVVFVVIVIVVVVFDGRSLKPKQPRTSQVTAINLIFLSLYCPVDPRGSCVTYQGWKMIQTLVILLTPMAPPESLAPYRAAVR